MNSRRMPRIFVLAASLCALLAACGGGDGGGQPLPPAQPATIGASGGTFTSPQGASVSVPAGALASDVAIRVAPDTSGASTLPADIGVSDVFALTPHGTSFNTPATLTLPIDLTKLPAGANVVLVKTDATLTNWALVPGATVSGASISGAITGFSLAVAVPPPTILQQPADQTVSVGQSATFSVVAAGRTPGLLLAYRWESSVDRGATWTVIPGETAASYTTLATVNSDNGKRFRVTVSLQALPFVDVVSAAAQIVIPNAPPPPMPAPMVAAGVHHTLALKADGTVWAWGRNDQGQLGNRTNTMSTVPVQSVGLPTISKVAVGHYHSLALAVDGSVWEWGNQLNVPGVPTQVAMSGRFTDIADGDFFSIALRDDGTVWSWSGSTPTTPPAQVSGTAGVIAISAGTNQALALKNDFTALAWIAGGNAAAVPSPNGTGVLGAVQWIRAISGAYLALAFDGVQGTLYTWGGGLSQFGLGSTNPRAAPALQPYASVSPDSYAIAIGRGTTSGAFLLIIDGANGNAVKGLGANLDGELGIGTTIDATTATPLLGLLDVRQVDATRTFQATYAVARKGDGTVWAWGDNSTGQLGDGTTTRRLVPVQVQGLNLN